MRVKDNKKVQVAMVPASVSSVQAREVSNASSGLWNLVVPAEGFRSLSFCFAFY